MFSGFDIRHMELSQERGYIQQVIMRILESKCKFCTGAGPSAEVLERPSESPGFGIIQPLWGCLRWADRVRQPENLQTWRLFANKD